MKQNINSIKKIRFFFYVFYVFNYTFFLHKIYMYIVEHLWLVVLLKFNKLLNYL